MGIDVTKDIKVCTDGARPLVAAICKKIGLSKNIDGHIESEQSGRIVTTGKAIAALVMNIVSGKRPLYKVAESFEETDTEKLFGEGVNPRHLTDDLMARALDELYKIGPKKVMTETAMSIIKEYNIPVNSIHADTTSKSLYGDYNDCDEDTINITQGHSKDHRPDLKQILFGLGVTKDKIIVIGDVMNGNTSDKSWNKDILKELRELMKKQGLPDFIYVADSAAVTEGMLEELAGNNDDNPQIMFISRLPGTYGLEDELKQKAIDNSENWEEIGCISAKDGAAQYKVQSFIDNLYGKKYRFIVCYSSQLDQRKAKTLENNLEKEKGSALKVIKKFEHTEFYCKKDAQEAFEIQEKATNLKYHVLTYNIETLENPVKRKKIGRPPKTDVKETQTTYKVHVKLHDNDVSIKEYRERNGMFVLVTNILDTNKMDNEATLKEYKEQSSVENNFRVLKDPAFIDELFLKTPTRVEALAYVILIALMVLTLLERTVRENLKGEKERLIVSGNRKTLNPTGTAIIETLSKIAVILIYNQEKRKWERRCDLNENLKRLVHLAGFDESIYVIDLQKVI